MSPWLLFGRPPRSEGSNRWAGRIGSAATMPAAAAFYAGLALTAGATLALEILQVRILSVVSWYHLAFFVISIAMFGMTAGALYVFARPQHFLAEAAPRQIARHALFAA